jgi:deoxyribonuclease-4
MADNAFTLYDFAHTHRVRRKSCGFQLNLCSIMPTLGAHQSIAGGYFRASERARDCGCECVQLFTKNNNQWRAKEITSEDAQAFRASLKACGLSHPLAHDSYLINLAAPDQDLWAKSIDSFVMELLRAEKLGIPHLVTHPGSYTTTSEAAGLRRIIDALDEAHRQTRGAKTITLLEVTAGQGTNLGHRFEHLATILDGVQDPDRLAVCLDTCHLFAAGYPLAPEKDYQATIKSLSKILGLKLVKAIHLNDSKRELGSRVDRHEHIGKGRIGLEGFRLLLNDPRFAKKPMYLETPKEENGEPKGLELDRTNLAVLRSLVE